MGAITADDAGSYYRSLGYDTSNDGERVGQFGVEQSMETDAARHVGQGRSYEVDAASRIVREVSETPPSTARTSS